MANVSSLNRPKSTLIWTSERISRENQLKIWRVKYCCGCFVWKTWLWTESNINLETSISCWSILLLLLERQVLQRTKSGLYESGCTQSQKIFLMSSLLLFTGTQWILAIICLNIFAMVNIVSVSLKSSPYSWTYWKNFMTSPSRIRKNLYSNVKFPLLAKDVPFHWEMLPILPELSKERTISATLSSLSIPWFRHGTISLFWLWFHFCCHWLSHQHQIPTSSRATAVEVAHQFIDNIFRLHGLPQKIVSDRDPNFTSKFWKALSRYLQTTLKFSTTYHPQTYGQTERLSESLEVMLRHHCSANQTLGSEVYARLNLLTILHLIQVLHNLLLCWLKKYLPPHPIHQALDLTVDHSPMLLWILLHPCTLHRMMHMIRGLSLNENTQNMISSPGNFENFTKMILCWWKLRERLLRNFSSYNTLGFGLSKF